MPANRPGIIFISNQVSPKPNSGGGSIVVYRHLKRLKEAGHRVVFLHSSLHRAPQHIFEEIHIAKQVWFPPLRQKTPYFTRLRIWIYFQIIKNKLKPRQGDIVLSILGDYSNLLALKLSKHFKIPLYMIYHDDSLFNTYGKLNVLHKSHVKDIIQHTRHFFAVSEPMKSLLDEQGAISSSVLYPIPEGYAPKVKSWDSVDRDQLLFYNSGLLFEDLHLELIEVLADCANAINAGIRLVGRLKDSFEKHLERKKNIKITDRFEKTHDLLEHLAVHADVLLVFYSFKTGLEHRMFHSFPSKFAEYCHLGLPIFIIAPVESSIGKWAKEHEWQSYISTDDPHAILNMMERFREKAFWSTCQSQSLYAANHYFNPDNIHQQLSSIIFNNEA